MRSLLPTLLALFISFSARADPGVWMGQALTMDLAPAKDTGPALWLDLHERQTGPTFNAIVRPGVGYQIIKGLTVWAGYGWIPTVSDDVVRHEHRIWQQVIGQGAVGGIKLMGRLRFEQRWLEDAANVGLRLRAFERVGIPLKDPVGLSIWDETFLRLNDNGGNSAFFDQNRLFVGLYHQAEGVRVEMGYLNLIAGTDGTVHHLAAAYVFLSPKLKAR